MTIDNKTVTLRKRLLNIIYILKLNSKSQNKCNDISMDISSMGETYGFAHPVRAIFPSRASREERENFGRPNKTIL